jgi:hypothetical protein
VFRANGGTETTRENIQDWLQLDEGDPGFQLLTEEEIAAIIFLFIVIGTIYIIKFSKRLRSRKQRLTALGIHCADYATPSTHKGWH